MTKAKFTNHGFKGEITGPGKNTGL